MDPKMLSVSLCCFVAAALAAFDVKPIVFPADSPATVTVRAENDAERKILAETPLYYISSQGHWSDGKLHGKSRWRPVWEKIEAKRGDGELTFTVRLNGEGWHSLWFGVPDAKWNFPAKTTRSFMLYSLKPDLFKLRPWKGDIHQHSVRCGHAKLEPKVIPAYNRRVGFDFMALSEHRQQAPSVEAIEAATPWECGLVLFTGEEFHTERNILHSVAVGHTSGINAWQQAHPGEFKRRVDEELKKTVYDSYGMEPYLRRNAAMAKVLYQVGRELGAKVLVYSHPTDLIYGKQDDPPESYRTFMLENGDYDALELPNGATGRFNPATGRADRIMLMNSLAMELLERGRRPAFVAASDNHNQATTYFGRVHTVFFAEKCDLENFAAAVKARRTLAVRDSGTPTYMIFGPSRLIKFQQFLEQAYWPGHDQLCRRQGELLLKLVEQGDRSVLPEVQRLAKAIDDYRESSYAAER